MSTKIAISKTSYALLHLNLYLKSPEGHLHEIKFKLKTHHGVWTSVTRPARHTASDMSNKVTAMRHREQMNERVVTGLTEGIGGDAG